MFLKLLPKSAAELRTEAGHLLRKDYPQTQNHQGRGEPVQGHSYSDKEVTMVVLDKQDYIDKAQDLLTDKDT